MVVLSESCRKHFDFELPLMAKRRIAVIPQSGLLCPLEKKNRKNITVARKKYICICTTPVLCEETETEVMHIQICTYQPFISDLPRISESWGLCMAAFEGTELCNVYKDRIRGWAT